MALTLSALMRFLRHQDTALSSLLPGQRFIYCSTFYLKRTLSLNILFNSYRIKDALDERTLKNFLLGILLSIIVIYYFLDTWSVYLIINTNLIRILPTFIAYEMRNVDVIVYLNFTNYIIVKVNITL